MTALTADRNSPARSGEILVAGMAASITIYGGAIVMRNSTGHFTKGQTATGLVGVGRAEERKTSSAVAGADTLEARTGIFRYGNSTSTDLITIAEIGTLCYVVDDQTVAKTSNSAARSPAGFVFDVDAQGVWVEFDETRVRSHVAGITLPT